MSVHSAAAVRSSARPAVFAGFAVAFLVLAAAGFLGGRLLGGGFRSTRTLPLPSPAAAAVSVRHPTISNPLGAVAALPSLKLPAPKKPAARTAPQSVAPAPHYVAPPPTVVHTQTQPKVVTCVPC